MFAFCGTLGAGVPGPDHLLLRETTGPDHDPPGRRLLRNVAAAPSRLHPLADLLGVRDPLPDSDAQLRMADSPLLEAPEPSTSILALNVGIDVASGRAIRARVADVRRIATTALTTRLQRLPDGGPLQFTSWVEHVGEQDERGYRPVVCGARVHDDAGQLATGSFSALMLAGAAGAGTRPLDPAERMTPATRADLDKLLASGDDGLTRALLLDRARLAPAPAGAVTIPVRPLLGNLFGHLQGGAVPSIADLLARDLLGRPELRPQACHWAFRGPLRQEVRFELEVVPGAASAHAIVRASEGGRLRGAGVIDYRATA